MQSQFGVHVCQWCVTDCGLYRIENYNSVAGVPVFWYKVRLTISLKTGQVEVRYIIRYSF